MLAGAACVAATAAAAALAAPGGAALGALARRINLAAASTAAAAAVVVIARAAVALLLDYAHRAAHLWSCICFVSCPAVHRGCHCLARGFLVVLLCEVCKSWCRRSWQQILLRLLHKACAAAGGWWQLACASILGCAHAV